MATQVYMRSSKLSYVELFDMVAAFIGDAPIDVDEFCDKVVLEVNEGLPESMLWYPRTSEIWIRTDDDSEIELDEVMNMISEAVDLVAEDYEEEA